MLTKSSVLEIIEKMPEKFSMDLLFEQMSFVEKVEQGLNDIKKGHVLTEVELENEMKIWFK